MKEYGLFKVNAHDDSLQSENQDLTAKSTLCSIYCSVVQYRTLFLAKANQQ